VADLPLLQMTGQNGFQGPSDRVEAVMSLLSPFERITCGVLVRRQMNGPTVARGYERWGPMGTAKLCTARAFALYVLPLSIATALFARAGIAAIAVPLLIIVGVLFILGLRRGLAGFRAAQGWRSGEGQS